MKKIIAIFAAVSLLFTLVPPAQAADLYANELVAYSFADLLSPQNALGEPDGMYADFRDQETYLKVDMGESEQGRDGVTLFFQSLNYGATAVVTYYSDDGAILSTDSQVFATGATEWTSYLTSSAAFRFVKIESPETEQWRLDAIQAVAINSPVIDEGVDEVQVEEEPVDDHEIGSNTLIKLADSDAVYVVGNDGKRHPFPNEITFFSWGYSFDDVEIVDAETMASFLIGGSVTIKPGTYLVKLQTIPKVYAVAPDHTLRWITSEELAVEIYGSSWASEVVDISDAFWPDYVAGEIINTPEDILAWETELQPF